MHNPTVNGTVSAAHGKLLWILSRSRQGMASAASNKYVIKCCGPCVCTTAQQEL